MEGWRVHDRSLVTHGAGDSGSWTVALAEHSEAWTITETAHNHPETAPEGAPPTESARKIRQHFSS